MARFDLGCKHKGTTAGTAYAMTIGVAVTLLASIHGNAGHAQPPAPETTAGPGVSTWVVQQSDLCTAAVRDAE